MVQIAKLKNKDKVNKNDLYLVYKEHLFWSLYSQL